jgi:hypothetical protein
VKRTAALLAVAAALVAACGSGGASTGTLPPAASSPVASKTLDPNFDTGQTVTITGAGFAPHWLVAVVDQQIVWTNATSKPVEVVFDSGTVSSGPIAPGASFSYTPNAQVAIAYHAGDDAKVKGVVQVEPEYMPGETPVPASP